MADDLKPRIGTPLQAIRFFQEFIEPSSSQDWFRAWDDGDTDGWHTPVTFTEWCATHPDGELDVR